MHRCISMDFSEVLLNNPLTKHAGSGLWDLIKCRNTEVEHLEGKRWVWLMGFHWCFFELICHLVLSFEKNTIWVSG